MDQQRQPLHKLKILEIKRLRRGIKVKRQPPGKDSGEEADFQ